MRWFHPIIAFSSIMAVVPGCGGSSQSAANRAPLASAGDDASYHENAVVGLLGSGSDPDGDMLSYRWSQLSGPPVDIAEPTDPTTEVTLPEVPVRNSEPVVLQLQVTDVNGATATDRVSLSVVSTDYLVFVANKDDFDKLELFQYDPEADFVRKLSGPLATGGDIVAWAVSPDGSRVAYRADQDVDGVVELYIAAADGSGVFKANTPLQPQGDVDDFH